MAEDPALWAQWANDSYSTWQLVTSGGPWEFTFQPTTLSIFISGLENTEHDLVRLAEAIELGDAISTLKIRIVI